MERTRVAPGASPPPATVKGEPPPPEHTVPVVQGQRFQATVVAQTGERIWFGYRGAVVAARTAVQLEVGRTFEFLVAATAPQIELVQVRPAGSPAPMPAAETWSLPGALLATVLGAFAASTGRKGESSAQLPMPLHGALLQWAAGAPSSAALIALDQHLGHEHEARVLRLPPPTAAVDVAAAVSTLRGAAKARALVDLADQGEATLRPSSTRGSQAAWALIAALSQVERDNAARVECGAPLWLPLPACPAAGLTDARMFLMRDRRDADGDARPRDDGAFTVVLLLDLTTLGELRVDVALRGARLDATFVAVKPATTELLLRSVDDLRARLGSAGIDLDRVQLRTAPPQGLPRADLVLPPRDGTALVDLHA